MPSEQTTRDCRKRKVEDIVNDNGATVEIADNKFDLGLSMFQFYHDEQNKISSNEKRSSSSKPDFNSSVRIGNVFNEEVMTDEDEVAENLIDHISSINSKTFGGTSRSVSETNFSSDKFESYVPERSEVRGNVFSFIDKAEKSVDQLSENAFNMTTQEFPTNEVHAMCVKSPGDVKESVRTETWNFDSKIMTELAFVKPDSIPKPKGSKSTQMHDPSSSETSSTIIRISKKWELIQRQAKYCKIMSKRIAKQKKRLQKNREILERSDRLDEDTDLLIKQARRSRIIMEKIECRVRQDEIMKNRSRSLEQEK